MIPFKTTAEQILNLTSITSEMTVAGVDPEFIVNVCELARTDQGVYDLMEMWSAAKSGSPEREELLDDLRDALDDYAKPTRKL